MTCTVAAKHLLTGSGVIQHPVVTFEDGQVTSISSRIETPLAKASYNFEDATLSPGLFDIHMHGSVGCDVMDGSNESLTSIGLFLASHGVTEYLATTVTASMDFTLRALDTIGAYLERKPDGPQARIRGVHIEGPFLSHAKRGMHPPEHLLPPSPDVLDTLWEASRGHIVLMTIAPELPGAIETIKRANELGIRCSLGHSDANTTEAMAGLEAGAVSATHTFNAMRPLNHRDPGIIGIVLDRNDLYADLICDGVHVAPELVRLWFKAKGPERAILITDALQATGMASGIYRLGETRVRVQEGRCLTDNGVLAGSVITLDQAVQKMRDFTGADLCTAIQLASRNPRRMLGWENDLQIGSEATFNVYGESGNLRATFVRGKLLP